MSTCSLTHTDFQKWIGYNDVKSQPVYFYVQKNTSFSTPYTPIPFEIERLKIGGAKQANENSDPKHYLMNRFKVIVQIYLL